MVDIRKYTSKGLECGDLVKLYIKGSLHIVEVDSCDGRHIDFRHPLDGKTWTACTSAIKEIIKRK